MCLLTLDSVCTQMTLSWLPLPEEEQVRRFCAFLSALLLPVTRQKLCACLRMPFSIEGQTALARRRLSITLCVRIS